ncbi:MAG: helix-turn-helix domain-containing protein [archaeon]|jgi:DNA-binding HxlR family transcriptional regulator
MAKVMEKTNSLEKALKLIGKKYDLLILDALLQGRRKRRFNQLLKDIPNINPRILSMRLKELEKNNLVVKSIVLGTPVKTEYSLTEKAEELVEIIEKIKQWVDKN